MSVVPVIIAPQRSIALLEIRLNWGRLFKVREIPDEGEDPVVGNAQWGKTCFSVNIYTKPFNFYSSTRALQFPCSCTIVGVKLFKNERNGFMFLKL